MSQSHSICNHRWEQRLDRPVPVPVQIDGDEIRSSKKPGCGQTAAGVAADCTAVCCCCPFAIVNLFIFFFVKIPVGIAVRSVRWVKHRAHKCRHESCSCKTRGVSLLYSFDDDKDVGCLEEEKEDEKDVVFVFDSTQTKEEMELEKEMINNLSGFGRSLSQRHEYSALHGYGSKKETIKSTTN